MNAATIRKPIIGIIGGNTCTPEDYKIAEEVGRLVAVKGANLICGGMGGIMEAACKGALTAGGITIGILPSDEIHQANPYVQIPVSTGMGIGRNIIIVRTARALIAINGKYGTLSEISYAMQLNKPVFSLSPWIEVPGVEVVHSPLEAVEKSLV